jgi:hypothetical protein
MAHYAKVNAFGVVEQVIVASMEFIDTLPDKTSWLQTSYNTHGGIYYTPDTNVPDPDQSKAFRKNYAAVGFSYFPEYDGFAPPKPFPSWILNPQTCFWEAPVPYPNDGKEYVWDEETQSWVEVVQ